jgi:hypothetical protein
LCNVNANSANDLERHLIGARHRKAVAIAAATPTANAPAAIAAATPHSIISSSSSSAVVPSPASAVPHVTAAAAAADPLSGCPKPRSTALHANSSSNPTQETAVQRESIDTQGDQDSLAQKKVGDAPSASASNSAASSLQCHVCDRGFKREADMHTHLHSKQHADMLAAFHRGSANACSFAFTLCRSALLYYPAVSPEMTSSMLSAERADFAHQLSRFFDGAHAKRSLLALQQTLAQSDWESARASFLLALEGGLSTLATHLRREGELGEQLEADADEFDDEYATVFNGDGDWQDEEDELGYD